jgi:hypothetical protein
LQARQGFPRFLLRPAISLTFRVPNGMKIENTLLSKRFVMKKSITKFLNASLRKLKEHKEQIKKFRFSSYPEDFVITEQEEREGGFFGSMNFNSNLKLKVN